MITILFPGNQHAGLIAIDKAEPLIRALVPVGTEEGAKLQLDQLLQAMAGQIRDQLSGAAAIE